MTIFDWFGMEFNLRLHSLKDACMKLQENGALDKILDRLEPPELAEDQQQPHGRMAHMRIQSNILDNLRYVIYGDSLGYTIRVSAEIMEFI